MKDISSGWTPASTFRDEPPGDADRCVAAIIGKNPGSANPTILNCLSLLSLIWKQAVALREESIPKGL
jgi:hypothetical protein